MREPILITGIPRSGATAIAATIHQCGAFGGNMSKRGMYSNDTIREEFLKPYLENIGADKEGQHPLPPTSVVTVPAYWRQRIEQVMIDEGYKDGPWMYKDSRLALTWPLWNISFPNAKWIIVRRRTGDVIKSCIKTGYMRAFKDPALLERLNVIDEAQGWLQWVHEYEKKFVEIIDEKIDHKIIWPERMENGDYKQIFELCDWLGIKWNDKALENIQTLLMGNKK